MKPGWRHSSKANPCPVCKRPNAEHGSTWCFHAKDGSAAFCYFVARGNRFPSGAYLHTSNNGGCHVQHGEQEQARVIDWATLNKWYRKSINQRLDEQAKALGVAPDSLLRLQAGWDGEAITFPMRDAAGKIVGIRRRFPDGKKLSVRGGHEGCFVPTDLNGGIKFIVEGPTDCAALLTLHLDAIGRPNCLGGTKILLVMTRGENVIVVADNDPSDAGLNGAKVLCRALRETCKTIRLMRPPNGIKDSREWLRAGATRKDFERA